MLLVIVEQKQFEYDILSLTKAFFSEEIVRVVWIEEKEIILEQARVTFYVKMKSDAYSLWENDSMLGEIVFDKNALRPERKNKIKQMLYKVFAKYSNKELPWGTLTGIRPTKIPMLMLEEGLNKEQIKKRMKETYFISEEKAELSTTIIKREQEVLKKIHYKNGYSLYIGIPFCPTTCLYCSFTSYPIGSYKNQVAEYLSAMEKEMDFVAKEYAGKILDTVYIGGGTPTTLEVAELERLLTKIKSTFNFEKVQEFTVEAGRADSITREKLEVLKKYGVTRISVNPQTMNAETLKKIGRQATPEQVKEAFFLARELGFENINMDLILGLPGENKEDVRNTMKEIAALKPDSLTVHSLAIKRASKLYWWIIENGIAMINNTSETMKITEDVAREMDMLPYYLYRQKNMSGNLENVGYATDGKFGIYNIVIMEEKQSIIAVGAGSISKVVLADGRIKRCDCMKDVTLYIEKIDEMIERKRELFTLEKIGGYYGVK